MKWNQLQDEDEKESAGGEVKWNQVEWGWNGISWGEDVMESAAGGGWKGISWGWGEMESAGMRMRWNRLQVRMKWGWHAKSFLFPGSGTSSVFLSTSPFCFSSLLVSFFSSFSSVTVFSSLPSSLSATSAGTVTQNKEKLFIIFHSVNTLLYLGREAIYFCVRT